MSYNSKRSALAALAISALGADGLHVVFPPYTSTTSVSLLLRLRHDHPSTFVLRSRVVSTARTHTRLLGAQSDYPCEDDDNPPSPPPSSSGSKNRRRRKRCVDFPSSAYKQRPTRSRSRPPQTSGSVNDDGTTTTPSDSIIPSVKLGSRRKPNASIFEPEFARIELAAERSRLVTARSYARNDAFLPENINQAPTLDDLSRPDVKPFDRLWASAPFRVAVLVIAYYAFPYLCVFLDEFVTMKPDELDGITSKFGPGISILYGTFISLTLNILYSRQQKIQDCISTESALITLVQRQVLQIFRNDREMAIEGSQCVADQIRTLVRGSRGQELMGVMYSDPYARILELIEEREYRLMQENNNDLGAQGVVLGSARDVIKDLVKARAQRLSNEALALPPTHFFILTVLTLLILLGYTVSILPTVDLEGKPSQESSLLFAVLCAVYVLFYNFTNDINDAFRGVYQIRRSATASHLLQTKFLIANHPLVRGEVSFSEVSEEVSTGDVQVRSPGLGDMMIGKAGFYPPEAEKQMDE